MGATDRTVWAAAFSAAGTDFDDVWPTLWQCIAGPEFFGASHVPAAAWTAQALQATPGSWVRVAWYETYPGECPSAVNASGHDTYHVPARDDHYPDMGSLPVVAL